MNAIAKAIKNYTKSPVAAVLTACAIPAGLIANGIFGIFDIPKGETAKKVAEAAVDVMVAAGVVSNTMFALAPLIPEVEEEETEK